MVLVLCAPLAVGVRGSLHWSSIGGRRSHLHRPVRLSRHTLKIFFPSYFTYVAYFSTVTVHPASHRWDRPRILFISPDSVAALLALAVILCRVLRWFMCVALSG